MKKHQNKIILTLYLLIVIVNLNIIKIFADTNYLPELNPQGVYLMDGYTGEVLYEKNSNVKFEPASTTKVMTAIITLENVSLDEKVKIGENPPYTDGSAIGVVEGEVYTVKELLYALLLPSANDAAVALAEYVAGSTEKFAEMMTEKAHEIGATSTTFKNPSGLHDEGHLTTAHDLALILQYALKYDDFIKISSTSEYKYEKNPYSDGSEKWAVNQNNCLAATYALVNYPEFVYDNLYCGKTGYTPEANHTYVAAAKKGDQLLIASFLNADDKAALYGNVGPLFEWGFANYKTKKIVSEGDKIGEYNLSSDVIIPLLATKDVYYTFSSSDVKQEVDIDVDFPSRNYSAISINKGDILFNNASLLVNGQNYGTIDLASGLSREYTAQDEIKDTIISLASNKLFIPALAVIVTLVIIFIIKVRKKVKYLKRRRIIRRKHNF